MNTDGFNLDRFLDAQEQSYAIALRELRDGKKCSHWIWYVFPQIKGLGFSLMSERFGLDGLAEARAYLAAPLLGRRLLESVDAMLAHYVSAESILGELDALKFKSCLTLFSLADYTEPIFIGALERFFSGERDMRTVELLKARGDA